MIVDNKFYLKNGWINLYKPSGVTSSECTYKIRKLLTQSLKKIGILPEKDKISCGHMGTLDPMAEGVLPIAIGLASKTIPMHTNRHKEYDFTIYWGIKTDTDDAFGSVLDICDKIPSDPEIENAIKYFIGEIKQIPSCFSAIHINGIRAYKLARMGQSFTMPSRKVFIFDLEHLKSYRVEGQNKSKCFSEFNVKCSTGTYVRTLASDISNYLKTVGHLTKLKRVQNGSFDLANSFEYQKLLDFFEAFLHTDSDKDLDSFVYEDVRVLDFLKPIDYKLDGIPVIFIDEDILNKFISGCPVQVDNPDGFYRVYPNSRMLNIGLIGFAEVKDFKMYPKKVFNVIKKV